MRHLPSRPAIVTSAIAAALLISPASLRSQSSDSTMFRPGQWGAEFAMGGFSGLGVLRFSTPTRAWIGQVNGRLDSADSDEDAPSFSLLSNRLLQLRLGSRWFRPVADDVLQHITTGAYVGTSAQERQVPTIVNDGRQSDRSNTFGLFADLGAQWMVTNRLSLGASYGLQAGFSRTNSEGPSAETSLSSTSVSVGPVSIRGALYF